MSPDQARPTGHRTVRVDVVVVVVGLLWGNYLKSQGHFFVQGHFLFFASILFSHPKFPSGWDLSRSIRICQPSRSPTLNFLWGGPDFSSRWDLRLSKISV